jgi:threonine dehydratase
VDHADALDGTRHEGAERAMKIPTRDDVLSAAQRISGLVKRTPVMTSRAINTIVGAELYFKCEHLQSTGAFKFRGASHVLSLMSDEEKKRGVITHSSGNHAQALALAAKRAGVAATIVMPQGSNPLKKAATEGYGANVIECINTQEERERTCHEEMARTGMLLVHPYDDWRIISGAGTAALELLEEVPDLDAVIAPVGGGGLLAGTSLATTGRPVFAAEPAGADDAYRGFKSGIRVAQHTPETVSDGLRTCVGELNFKIIKEHVEDIALATDEETIQAMKLVHTRMKQLIEPSSAVPLACLLNGSLPTKGKIGIIISGGNVAL